MNRNLILLFLPVLLLTGCLFTKHMNTDGIEGSWTLYDVTAGDQKNIDFNTEASLKGSLQTGSVLSFFKDSSFTKAEGNGDFAAGNWSLRSGEKVLVLTDRNDETKVTPVYIEAPSAAHSSFVLVIERGDFLYKYVKTAAPLKDEEEDPFYAANNNWRMTPEAVEDSTQVRERLANYLKHLALLLRAANERKETVVSFVFSQGPVMIYNSGIGIVPYVKVKRCWKNGFYDDGEAQYAYKLYGDYLSEGHFIGAGTGNWIEDDYRILMSIYPAFHTGMKELTL